LPHHDEPDRDAPADHLLSLPLGAGKWARGKVLNLVVESPTYEVAGMGQVPYLDCVATSSDDGKTTLFILNRDLAKAQTVEVNWEDKAPGSVLTSTTLTGSDLKAFNTFDSPNRVVPQLFRKTRYGQPAAPNSKCRRVRTP